MLLGKCVTLAQFIRVAEIIRLIGVVNAGAWFGSLLFFTIAAGPAFFSLEMTELLGRPHAGAAAQIVIARLFQLQFWFAGVALLQVLAAWLYTGRPVQKLTSVTLGCVVAFVLVGGFYASPRLKALHLQKYAMQSTSIQKVEAARAFGAMHGFSQLANLLVLGGVLFHFWQMYRHSPVSRFAPANKFRPPSNGSNAG